MANLANMANLAAPDSLVVLFMPCLARIGDSRWQCGQYIGRGRAPIEATGDHSGGCMPPDGTRGSQARLASTSQ